MIFGRGHASTDEAIIAEFHELVNENMGDLTKRKRIVEIHAAPRALLISLGSSISSWKEQEVLTLYQSRSRHTQDIFNPFLAFLVFRGYYHPSFGFLDALKIKLSQQFAKTLTPYRRKIEELHREYGYQTPHQVGYELSLLIWVLATVHKPLEELTRADFDQFKREYRIWYQSRQAIDERSDTRLVRLDRYLVHWGVIAPVGKRVPCIWRGVARNICLLQQRTMVQPFKRFSCGWKTTILHAVS